MKACPNCSNPVPAESAVCECGELLRAEVTHIQPWETETVLGTRSAPAKVRNLTPLIVLVAALTIIGLAWIGIRQNLSTAGSENKDDRTSPSDQSLKTADTQSHDDDLTSGSLSSQEGVFVFSSGNRSASRQSTVSRSRALNGRSILPATSDLNPTAGDPPGSNLQPEANPAASNTTDNAKADCKPEISLKKPDPPTPAVDKKPLEPKTAGTQRTYVLGPRGGCFFVTPGGGKKYVDRGLCSQTITAGSRQ